MSVTIRVRSGSILTAAVAVIIFAFAWAFRFNDPNGSFAFLTDDHFFYLVRGWQILFSELPVRDFVDHGAPLYFYVGAAVQLLFGRGTLSELVFCVTVLAGCAAGVFLLATRASGSRLLGAGAALFHIFLDPRFYNYPKILVYVAAIPAIWAFADRQSYRRAALIAVITVIGFLFRHDHGAFVAATFLVLVAVVPGLPLRQRVQYAIVYGAIALALVSPYLVFLERNGGVVSYFRTASAWAERDRGRAPVVWPGLFDNPDGVSEAAREGSTIARAVATVQDNWVAWEYYGQLALPFAALALLGLSPAAFRSKWRHATSKIGVVAVLGILLNAGFLRSPLDARLSDPSVPHAILLAWICAALGGLLVRADLVRTFLWNPARLFAVRVAATTLIGGLLVMLVIPTTMGLTDRFESTKLIEGWEGTIERARSMWEAAAVAFPISQDPPEDPYSSIGLAYYVRQCTQPTDRVFMQHYLPQVVALAERGFAGGHADLRPGMFDTVEMQRLTVARLERQSVPLVFVGGGDELGGFRTSFPIVVRYFDENYVSAGEHAFEEGRFPIRLLVRRDRMPTGRYAPLDWPCFGR